MATNQVYSHNFVGFCIIPFFRLLKRNLSESIEGLIKICYDFFETVSNFYCIRSNFLEILSDYMSNVSFVSKSCLGELIADVLPAFRNIYECRPLTSDHPNKIRVLVLHITGAARVFTNQHFVCAEEKLHCGCTHLPYADSIS